MTVVPYDVRWPGLCAKPVLDILVSIPDRHFFRRRRDDARTHHLSLAEPASHHHRVTLAFRDALRADPGLSAAYAALKSRLARQYPRNRGAYIGGKAGFVARVLADRGVAGHDAAVQA